MTILLRPPKVELSYDSTRMRGKPDAPIVIVEFADFQCPFCQAIQPTLAGLLAKYESKVSFAFRDFPLRPIHPLAQGAAEAARCAADQVKFWEYYDRLYTAPSRLEPENLAEHARSAGLDEARFRSCVASGKFRAQIEQDLQDGAKAGVAGTPTFFINGVPVSGVQPASVFEKIIEAELEAIKTQKPGAKQ